MSPGSFADFSGFAAEIAAALQDGDTSFFDEHAAPSVWNCLGDEVLGVCKDMPEDTTLKGIPVASDWTTYEVQSSEDYRAAWKNRFASSVLMLAAVAHQWGDNPLMPMAGQSFLAIVRVADKSNPSSTEEVRVLFFEYHEQIWRLRGEFVTSEQAEAWLTDHCPACYDVWAAWPE